MKASSIHLGNNVAHLRFGKYNSKSDLMPDPEKIIADLQFSYWYGMDFVLDPFLSISENAFGFINKALDIAKQSYIDEPGGEEGNCAELVDNIKDSLLFFNEESLDFLIKWPHLRNALSNLGYAVDNGVPLYPILQEIETVISEAMLAKRNGIFIPETGMFVNLNKTGQINSRQFDTLKTASRMLDDLGYGISSTGFLNLEIQRNEDSYAIAWRTLGLTDLNLPIENDLVSDDIVSFAQYLGHENSHHVWDELFPDGVMIDPELIFDSETNLVVNDNPNEVLGEVLANSLDMSLALSLRGNRDLNRSRLEENCTEIDRLISGLKQPQYIRNMTNEGLYILDQSEAFNRRNWFAGIKKSR